MNSPTPAAAPRPSSGSHGPVRGGWPAGLAVTAAVLMLAASWAACAPAPTPPPAAAPVPFADAASFIGALEAGGLALEPLGTSVYTWFEAPAQTFNVGGSATDFLYVHEYADAAAAAAAARRVSPDGTHVISPENRDVLVQWMGEPHVYQNGPLLVVYIGQDQDVTARLSAALGPQFAGAVQS